MECNKVINRNFANIQNMMYLLGEQNFRNGFPYYNQNYRKRRMLFNPIIRNLFIVLFVTKDLISHYIREDNYAVLIGDLFHGFQFKFQMTMAMTIAVIVVVLDEITKHFLLKNNKTMKLFIKNEYNERISTANKMKHIFKSIERLFTYSVYFNCFSMGLAFLSMYYSVTGIELMTIGIFWCIVFAQHSVYVIQHFSWNLLFFVSFCYYSKQLLKVENNRLQFYINSNSRFLFMSLKRFDTIHRKIFEYNTIWSQFLFIAVFGVGALVGLFAFQAFSPMIPNIYICFCFLFFMAIMISFVILIVIICSSVESEAKRSHKLLTKLNARRDLKISLTNSYQSLY